MIDIDMLHTFLKILRDLNLYGGTKNPKASIMGVKIIRVQRSSLIARLNLNAHKVNASAMFENLRSPIKFINFMHDQQLDTLTPY